VLFQNGDPLYWYDCWLYHLKKRKNSYFESPPKRVIYARVTKPLFRCGSGSSVKKTMRLRICLLLYYNTKKIVRIIPYNETSIKLICSFGWKIKLTYWEKQSCIVSFIHFEQKSWLFYRINFFPYIKWIISWCSSGTCWRSSGDSASHLMLTKNLTVSHNKFLSLYKIK
jgi:hypothetical protein